MSFGGLAAVDFRRPGDAFLSCLCGSELQSIIDYDISNFLSCLCGSERPEWRSSQSSYFLSCLCGSELLGFQL